MQAGRSRKSWWRRPRISVRAFMIVVVAIGGGLGWVVRPASIQRDAVKAIKSTGGDVWYDWENRYGPGVQGKHTPLNWLQERLGRDYFGRITEVVDLRAAGVAIPAVGRLTRLKSLHLDTPSMSEGGLGHLKGLTELEHLWIVNTQIDDADWANLKELTKLSSLHLDRSHMSDSGLAHLSYVNLTKQLSRRLIELVGAAELLRISRASRWAGAAVWRRPRRRR